MFYVFAAATLILTVLVLVDIITKDDWQVRHLPKFGWVILVVLVPLVGSIVWLVAGRDWSAVQRPAPGLGDPDRWSRDPAPAPTPIDTRSTEQQLADLEREIEEWEEHERKRHERD